MTRRIQTRNSEIWRELSLNSMIRFLSCNEFSLSEADRDSVWVFHTIWGPKGIVFGHTEHSRTRNGAYTAQILIFGVWCLTGYHKGRMYRN